MADAATIHPDDREWLVEALENLRRGDLWAKLEARSDARGLMHWLRCGAPEGVSSHARPITLRCVATGETYTWESQRAACRALHVSPASISDLRRGRRNVRSVKGWTLP